MVMLSSVTVDASTMNTRADDDGGWVRQVTLKFTMRNEVGALKVLLIHTHNIT